MGEVHMWRYQVVTQDVGVEVSQDLLCIPSGVKGQNHEVYDMRTVTMVASRGFVFADANLLYDTLLIHEVGLEAQHSEDHQRGQNRSEEVDDRDEHGVKVTVVVDLVVAGERYDPSEPQTQGEEDLGGCLPPHLGLQHLLQL